MSTQPRRTRIPLKEEWAADLLSLPSAVPSEGPRGSLGERLTAAREELASAVAEAQEVLNTRPVAAVVAAAAMRGAGRRGEASLVATADGLFVEITTQRKDGPPKKGWSSNLPSIQELRVEATDLGLDPEPFGRSKRKLQEAINGRRVKTAPALSVRTVTLEEAAEVFDPPTD